MALDGCGRFCKCALIIFNIIFAVLGFAMLGLGLWLRFSDSTRAIFQIPELHSSAFVTAVTILIALGVVMLIVVMFGDHGACNAKRCSLQVFSVLVAILAMAEVGFGVVGYANRDEVGAKIVEFYSTMYGLYVTSGGDVVIAATLILFHNMVHCCGMTGITPVEIVKNTCPAPDGFFERLVMPNCPAVIASFYDDKSQLVMAVFLGTGALLIMALVCAIILQQQTKRNQREITAHYTTVY